MKDDVKKFMEENCKGCNEKCNKGIVETYNFIRCVDKNITMNRRKENVYNEQSSC